ncbi:EamA-like transporter family protein [Dongia mobilis]|uniref:EamA-like transporter family protein n=1 Tax=Dongia mobilis TaxID=578943 RepID=A0A4R6WNC6_9PROT|nr:DMT family transporter [Dongia mobilis]TDQ82423.1 EamA-like transporter family protein [Dongia mobilis]
MTSSSSDRAAALALLVSTGFLIGIGFPLGKLAAQAGIPPAAWSFAISGGGALVILGVILARRQRIAWDRWHLRYYLVAGSLSYVFPNLLIYAAIPRLGAGLTAIYLTLSPIMTLTISIVMGLRRPGWLGFAGIALGCAGALTIILSKGELGGSADFAWAMAALLIPLSLAGGNVYRTLDWPAGGRPLGLAMGSNAAAALCLFVAALAWDGAMPFAPLLAAPLLTLGQIAVSAAMFALFFRLQVVGGPVYLSQIGYVAAATSLVIGTFLLGESYAFVTWMGGLVIVAGVVATTLDRGRK